MSLLPGARIVERNALLMFALGLGACDGASLDDRHGGARPPESDPTHIGLAEMRGGVATCPANHVQIADDDGLAYCVHEEFCLGRTGDYCAAAPKGVAATDAVTLWSDTLFWCRASGTLEQSATGLASIQVGDQRFEHGAEQLTAADFGCVSNPVGHGARDGACDAVPDRIAGQPGHPAFGACGGDGGDALECRFTETVDRRGASEQRIPRYEAWSRRDCALECSIDPAAPAASAASCGEDQMVRPAVAGACAVGYTLTPVLATDGRTVGSECVSDRFCARTTTASQMRQFCEDAPIDLVTGAAWAARRDDAGEGQVITAGARLIACDLQVGSKPTGIFECPEFGAAGEIAGQCVANPMGMACRDASVEARVADWALVRDCVEPRTLQLLRGKDGLLADPRCAPLAAAAAAPGFDRRIWDVDGAYCSDYSTARNDLTDRLTEVRWTEVLDGASGAHVRRLDVLRGVDDCARRGLACAREAPGEPDHCE